ncbi:hypothetical protein SK128_005201 [Halocaridina rubra]|uniref:Uncharacterized protein n=1 Tax=Halocaridina rubra TaxID=373956 RepID=A0AAN8X1E7_HALRR
MGVGFVVHHLRRASVVFVSNRLEGMAGGVCPFRLTKHLLYYTFLTSVLLIVLIAQGILLDVYIIYNDHTAISNYFWLVPDFLLVFGFVAAMAKGYWNCKPKPIRSHDSESKSVPQNDLHSFHVSILGKYYFPFYVWMVYSLLLVVKVAIIFKSELPNKLNENDRLSPQLLKMVMSLSCIIFALLVEGQVTTEPNSEREIYIKSLSHNTAFEILDSVTFISLLIQSESRLLLPVYLENAIIFFACLNFLLPGIALVKLSRCNYGQSTVCMISSVVYKLCHLWLINFTYFIIRLYLWGGFSVSVSPFIVKNMYHMVSIMKSVWGELKPLFASLKGYRKKQHQIHSIESRGVDEGIEMSATNNSSEWANPSDKFEEIDLKSDTNNSTLMESK